MASSLNTYAVKIQADLINSNQTKYFRETTTGDIVFQWLIVNTDIRKLERICHGKVPPKSQIQELLMEYDENFSVTQEHTKTDCPINSVKQLWERKGICFPGKDVLPNRGGSTTRTGGHVIYEIPTSTPITSRPSVPRCDSPLSFDDPKLWRKKRRHLEKGSNESFKTCPVPVSMQDGDQD